MRFSAAVGPVVPFKKSVLCHIIVIITVHCGVLVLLRRYLVLVE